MPDYNLKIVAFGDSLTAPAYTMELEGLVRNEGGVPNAAVVQKGYPGAITCGLEGLFEADVLQERPHAVVILVGTNDLGYAALHFLDSDSFREHYYRKYPIEDTTIEQLQKHANIGLERVKSEIVDTLDPKLVSDFIKKYVEHIFKHLVSMYSRAREQGIVPIAVAVPPANPTGFSRALIVPPRIALNDLIKRYCNENKIPYADLFTATADPETGLMLPQYSLDGLHFNYAGCKEMARIVFEQGVKPTMQKLTQI